MSILQNLLGRTGGQGPGVQSIAGTLAPGERVDIGALRAVNDGGYLAMRHLCHDGMLRWVASGADAEICISNLANQPDEGACFRRFPGSEAWAFVAKVRPERLVVYRPVPVDIPVVRTGPGGEFCQDWPAPEQGGRQKAEGESQKLKGGRQKAEGASRKLDGGALTSDFSIQPSAFRVSPSALTEEAPK